MSTLDILLTVTTISGWLAFGAAYQYLRTLRERMASPGELPAARALRQELEAAQRREQALIGGNQALQKRLDDAEERAEDAEDEVRHYREAAKVENIHNAWVEARKEGT